MLKHVLICINTTTEPSAMNFLTASLQKQGIAVSKLPPKENVNLQEVVMNTGTFANDCLLLTDLQALITAASQMDLACIGIQPLAKDAPFLSGADCVVESLAVLDYDGVLEEYNRAHGLPTTILTTKRLLIRELSLEDIPAMVLLYRQKEYVRFIPELDSLEDEIEKHRSYIQHIYNYYRFGLWGVFFKSTNTLIGRCGLQCIEIGNATEVELSYLLDHKYSRQGYGYEATSAILHYAKETLQLDSVIARIHRENIPSLRLAKKLGFHYESEQLLAEESIYRIDFNG